MLNIDPIALAMRVYRGVGPTPVDRAWIKGHVVAYQVSEVLRWRGDPRNDVAMFRDALSQTLTADDDEGLVRLFACVEAEKVGNIIGAEFTSKGRREYIRRIRGEPEL
jgi:hypothetical protein